MDKIEGVSRELKDYMAKNVFQMRKLCQDCRTFLFYSALKMERMRKYLFLIPLIILFPSLLFAESFVWQKIPLKSQLQHTMGQAGGEGHQMIFDIAVAKSNTSTVYFCTDTAAVWKSTDGGETWNPAWDNGYGCIGGQSVEVNPNDHNMVLVAGYDGVGSTQPGALSGIVRTTDGGATWAIATSTTYTSSNRYFTKSTNKGNDLFVWDINASGTVYCATYENGLLKSTDNGATWTLLDNKSKYANANLVDIKIHPTANPTELYICTSGSVYKKVIGSDPVVFTATLPTAAKQMIIDWSDPTRKYFACGSFGVLRYTDASGTSTAINSGMSTAISGGGICRSIGQDKSDANRLYASWSNNNDASYFYYSMNASGAGTWNVPTNYDTDGVGYSIYSGGGTIEANTWAVPIATWAGASGTAFIVTFPEHVVKTVNGGRTWTYTNTGYIAASTFPNTKNPLAYGSQTSYNGTTTYFLGLFDYTSSIGNGGTWTQGAQPPHSPTFANCKSVIMEPNTYAARLVASWGRQSVDSKLYYSDNYGASSWTAATAIGGAWVDTASSTLADWQTVNYHRNLFWPYQTGTTTPTSIVFAGCYQNTAQKGSLISRNRGASWSWLTSNNENEKSIADVYTGGNYICAVSGTTVYSAADALTYSSSDLFTRRNIVCIGANLKDCCFSATNPNKMYALDNSGTQSAVWVCTWSATSTSAVKYTITGSSDYLGSADGVNIISDKNITSGNDDIIYVLGNSNWLKAQGSGIWRSVDSGVTWTNITSSSNISGVNIYSLMVNPINRWIHIFGPCGNWKLPPPGLASEDITDSANQVQAKLTLDTMTIDGLGNEDAWSDANSITLNKTIEGTNTLTGSVTAKVLYDSTGFYVLVDIRDPNLHKDSSDSATHNDSSAEIYIDGDNNNSIPVLEAGTDRLFRVGWNRNISQIAFLPVGGTTTGVLYGSSTTATGYKEEWYVPFANIGYSGTSTLPQSPSLSLPFIGFDVFYNEDNNGGSRDAQLGWSGTTTNYLDTSEYGDLIFGTQTAGGSDIPTVVTGTVTPIATSTATLKGTITANNHDTDAWFRYGTISGSLGLVTSTSQFTGSTPGPLSKAITGLTENTLYYYQAIGSSTEGLAYGSELSFTTAATSQVTPLSGCISHWKFDENTGTSINDSVGTRTGTATGMTWTASGKLGSAGSFDGIDDFVLVNGLYGSPTAYTLSGWCYVIGSDTTGVTLISLGDYAGIYLRTNLSLKQQGFYYNGTDWKSTGSTTTTPFNEWHHYVYSVDDINNIQTLYIDGTYATTSTFTTNTQWSGQGTSTYMGKHGNGATNVDLNGYLDDVRIFNRALSAQEAIDLASIPVITGNGTATNITDSSCTFLGTASTNGSISANLYVQYGLSSGNYTGTSSPQINLTGSTTSSGASWAVSGLSQNTQYFYRLQVISDAYTINGTEQNFTTLAGYTLEEVTGINKPLSWSTIESTKFLHGLRNYGIYNWKTVWRSTADILRLIADPDNEITTAINNP